MFIVPAAASVATLRGEARGRSVAWMSVIISLIFVVGLRDKVGGDWWPYQEHFYVVSRLPIVEVVAFGDPGYYILNWLFGRIGGDIYLVNLACGTFLIAGMSRFLSKQPYPWLGLSIAIPYLIIVVGMGYTRQSAALGFAMLGLVSFEERKIRYFVIFIIIGALFHKSAVILLPIAALVTTQNKIWTWIWMAILSSLTVYFLLFESFDNLWTNYISNKMESEGGLIRVLMNIVPAIGFLGLRKQLQLSSQQQKLWSFMSFAALISIVFIPFASTAVDRLALYLIPLQLLFFSRLPLLFSSVSSRGLSVLGTISLFASVQFVWLNFATHAYAWIPYKFGPS